MIKENLARNVIRFVLHLPVENFSGLSIKALADHFEVSRCHLSRAFHADSGMTLTTFIKRQKLLRAERLLFDEDGLTVKELASRLGYSDCQHFIASFREHWGESPGRYRKLSADLAE